MMALAGGATEGQERNGQNWVCGRGGGYVKQPHPYGGDYLAAL